MRRIFNLYMRSYKPKFDSLGDLTTQFNQFVLQEYLFKAHTNKFMVRKWLENGR